MATRTANEKYRDALLRHQIGLLQVSESIRKDLIALLNDTEAEIASQLERKLSRIVRKGGTNVTTPLAVKRLEELQVIIKEIRKRALRAAQKQLREELLAMMKEEALFMAEAAATSLPVVFDFITPEFDKMRALVSTNPFQGAILSEWAKGLERDDLDRMMRTIRTGLVMGNTTKELTQSLFGLASENGARSDAQTTRRELHSIVRTSVNHFNNRVKQSFYDLNSVIIQEELYVATLDERTTVQCAGYDGQRYKVGYGPVPPVHWQCRSFRVPIFDPHIVSQRPAKPFTEKQLVREFTKGKFQDRKSIPHGRKGAFDTFKRKRVRELTGRVPGEQSFQEFLTSQSNQFQEDWLGPARAKLFRDGELKLTKFVNFEGRELTLRQLAARERAAFIKAGLDPDRY